MIPSNIYDPSLWFKAIKKKQWYFGGWAEGGSQIFLSYICGGGVEYVFPTGLGGSSKFLPTTWKCNRPPHLVINDSSLTDIDKSVKNRWLITAQVIKIKTMILCICITLLFVTFSGIIVSKIKSWFNWYSFYSLINFDMHDRFWQVSDTIGMPISQKLWIKLRNAEFHIIRIKWKSIYLSIKGRKCKMSNSNTQVRVK